MLESAGLGNRASPVERMNMRRDIEHAHVFPLERDIVEEIMFKPCSTSETVNSHLGDPERCRKTYRQRITPRPLYELLIISFLMSLSIHVRKL